MRRWGLVVCLALGCAGTAGPPLPALTEVGPTVRAGPQTVRAADKNLRALYITQRPREGIAPHSGQLRLLDAVAVLDAEGHLYVADVLHEAMPGPYRRDKLHASDILLASHHGQFTGERLLFSPDRDPLNTLDSGYVVDVRVGALKRRLIYRPLYDADTYSPYRGRGVEGAVGIQGRGGRSGGSGSDGSDGDDGSDGFTGKDGSGGEGGENGSAGSGGAPGRFGLPGGPADPGPDLQVTVRPIYSKFYPDEDLVFIRVEANYRHVGARSGYAAATQNYIIHPKQRFSVVSAGGGGGDGGKGGTGGAGGGGGDGGDGGEGGDGGDGVGGGTGRGGDGGNGGPGGDGGDGSDGGRGARGGLGGQGGPGGNGGQIAVLLSGPAAFRQQVRRYVSFTSRAGAGGAGGSMGSGGSGGTAGDGGDGGDGGDAGRGGNGSPRGSAGTDGVDGKDGDSGSRGKSGPWGKIGRPGAPGRAKAVKWKNAR